MRHNSSPFKWWHYAPDVILLCVRWYCRHLKGEELCFTGMASGSREVQDQVSIIRKSVTATLPVSVREPSRGRRVRHEEPLGLRAFGATILFVILT
jgi:hypothetical protein